MVRHMFSDIDMPSAKTIVSTGASIAASAMVVRSIARDLLPYQLQHYIFDSIRTFINSFSHQITLIIEEFDGFARNQIYKAAELYLGTKDSPSNHRFTVLLPEKEKKITTSMARNQEITDIYKGVHFKWRQITRQVETKSVTYAYTGQQSVSRSEHRSFELCFHRKHKQTVLDSYFPFILEESKKVKEEKKTLKIYTLNNDHMRRYTGADSWQAINLDHPATFDTLAMEPELKKMVIEDLERFVKRKEFYRRVGKAWKRGYLLYGPPGTGKSSLVAAMANYLNFDIYDLELTDINANSELRRLLISTANQSILVIEDIDCTLELHDRRLQAEALNSQTTNVVRRKKESEVTLSGFLNFIDGLWSSCGDERIIVFTTNHKDRLDPALLRPGRMDVHIHMSYCTPSGFRTLASNYIGLSDHCLFKEIEELLVEAMVTPAEVAEQLLKKEEANEALEGVTDFLKEKKRESERNKARELKKEEDSGERPTEI